MWATVIDAHYHAALVGKVGHPYPGAKGQAAVCGGETMLVERFAAGGAFAVVASAVIGSSAGLVVAFGVDVLAGAAGQQGEEGEGAQGSF